MRHIINVIIAVLFFAMPAFGQKARVVQNAPIYLEQDPPAGRTPLRTARVGTILRVLAQEGEWLQVEFQDPQFGPRVGWVRSQLVAIERPDLEPMDLSVPDDPAVQRAPANAPRGVEPVQSPQDVSSDAVRGRPQTREGFWFNVGLGFGSMGCQNCLARLNGLSGGLSLGGRINDKLLVGVGSTGWTKSEGDETLMIGTLDARLRFYPVRRSGFFLTGGVGIGTISYVVDSDLDSEFGVGVVLGLGWDIRVGRNVSLTPFWNGFAMSNSTVDANVGQLGLGVTIH